MTPTVETWLPLPGYEGYYEVSDLGGVRSVDRTITAANGRRMSFKGCLRKLQLNNGRVTVTLNLPDSGKQSHQVSVLVLKAFAGPRPPGMEGCHNNGDPLDNRLINLRWDTRSENHRDAVRHGTHHEARKTHCPRGHLLIAPNLQRSQAAQGMRTCLACQRAMAISYARPVDVWALADEKYKSIMQEASP